MWEVTKEVFRNPVLGVKVDQSTLPWVCLPSATQSRISLAILPSARSFYTAVPPVPLPPPSVAHILNR